MIGSLASGKAQYKVGDEALTKRGMLTLVHPIQKGLVVDWDCCEHVWRHTFYCELKVLPEDFPVLVTEVPLNPRTSREKMTTLLFAVFNVPRLYVNVQAVLSLYASGRTTGCVLDSGADSTHVVPCVDAYAVPHAIAHVRVTGRSITARLSSLAAERRCVLQDEAMHDTIVQDMKETLAYVALDYDAELAKDRADLEKSYELPDGKCVKIADERFRCPELLFRADLDPNVDDAPDAAPGVHACIHDAIAACDPSVRKELFATILLSGGNCAFPGLPERLAL